MSLEQDVEGFFIHPTTRYSERFMNELWNFKLGVIEHCIGHVFAAGFTDRTVFENGVKVFKLEILVSFFIKSFIFCIGLHDLSIRFCLLMYRFLGWRPESLSHPPLSWRQFPKSHCMQRCRLFSILLYRFISHRPLLQDEWVSFLLFFVEFVFFV